MSKSLTTRQDRLIGERSLAAIPLVVLTTYSDRDAETVDTRFYLSDQTVLYPYDGTDREFEPFLAAIGDLAATMPHLPEPGGGLGGQLRRTLDLTLLNAEDASGIRLIARLRQRTLEGATIEVAELPLDRAAGEGFFDLRHLSSSAHTVFYRGEVTRVGRVTEETLEIEATSRAPRIPWVYADDAAKNDPKDHGKHLPIVYGDAKRIPAIGWQVGWVTTLAQSFGSGGTGNVEVSTAVGLPDSGSFTLRISGEEVTASKVDSDTINISARGQNGTTATDHSAGEVAIEMVSEAVYILASHEVSALGALFIQNPFAGGELVRVTTSYTANTADSSVPGLSGTYSTARFTQAELRSLLDDLKQAAEVTQQPDFEQSGVEVVELPLQSFGVDESTVHVHSSSAVTTNTSFDGNSDTQAFLSGVNSDDDSLVMWIGPGQVANSSRNVVRYRIVTKYDISSDDAVSMQFTVSYSLLGEGATEVLHDMPSGDPTVLNQTAVTAWKSPTNKTLGDFENDAGDPVNNGPRAAWWYDNDSDNLTPDGSVDVHFGDTKIQVEVEPNPISRTTDTAIRGASVGFGLRFFGDVQGYTAPNGDYTVSSGNLLEHPADQIRHLLVELAGEGVDASAWSTLETRLSGNKHAFDLREVGRDLPEILGRLGVEMRTSLTQEEGSNGSVWRASAAQADAPGYSWPGSPPTLGEHGRGVEEEGRDLSESDGFGLYTRFRALYDVDRSSDASGEDRFRELLVANASTNDVSSEVTGVATAKQTYGDREHPGLLLLTVRDAATARDVFGYFVHELMRPAAVVRIPGVPWTDAYAMERQDLAFFALPWESSTRRLRVVGHIKSWDTGLAEVTGVEVSA